MIGRKLAIARNIAQHAATYNWRNGINTEFGASMLDGLHLVDRDSAMQFSIA